MVWWLQRPNDQIFVFRSFDYYKPNRRCFLSKMKCGDAGIVCKENKKVDYCTLSNECRTPQLQFANADKYSASFWDNITVTCDQGCQFADGKREAVHICLPGGKWRPAVQKCIPDFLIPYLCVPWQVHRKQARGKYRNTNMNSWMQNINIFMSVLNIY